MYPNRSRGAAAGSKLNRPLPPRAGDAEFLAAFAEVVAHVHEARPELILLQCGADSLAGAPLVSPLINAGFCRLSAESLPRYSVRPFDLIQGQTVVLTAGYQLIGGLRWLLSE